MTISGKPKQFLRIAGWSSALLIAAALPAAAHPGHTAMSGLAAGFLHPLSGLDHLLAMVAVGLWAGLCGGRRQWLWPAAFVGGMVAGSIIGIYAAPALPIEWTILGSVLLLGLATALGLRAPAVLGGLLIGLFGMAHGYAHGIEMPHTVDGLHFAAGFALATTALHLTGLGAATGLRHRHLDLVTRIAGLGIAVAGIGLMTGA